MKRYCVLTIRYTSLFSRFLVKLLTGGIMLYVVL